MKTMVDNQLFTGYSVGATNPMVVSHLQFADDTLLLGQKVGQMFVLSGRLLSFFIRCPV